MQVAIITVSFDEETKQFEQQELNDFLQGKRIEKMTEHFFMLNNRAHISFVIYYLAHHHKEMIILSDHEKAFFDKLRAWRNNTAKNLGFSPYIVLTNQQLKQITKLRPQHLSEIQQIKGIGQSCFAFSVCKAFLSKKFIACHNVFSETTLNTLSTLFSETTLSIASTLSSRA